MAGKTDKKYKASMLWHEMWVQGPMVGVCEYNEEKMIFARNNDGKYDLRRFKEDGYKKASRHHVAYRIKYGGDHDHDPRFYSPAIVDSTTEGAHKISVFDYRSNGVNEIVATLDGDDFKWFQPPRSWKQKYADEGLEKQDPSTFPGEDIENMERDSDESESEDEENEKPEEIREIGIVEISEKREDKGKEKE